MDRAHWKAKLVPLDKEKFFPQGTARDKIHSSSVAAPSTKSAGAQHYKSRSFSAVTTSTNFSTSSGPAHDPKVHEGYQKAYLDHIHKNLAEWIGQRMDYAGADNPTVCPRHRVDIAAHGIGAAFATFAGVYIKQWFPDVEIRIVTWGSPKIGSAGFKDFYHEIGLAHATARLISRGDPAPKFPNSVYARLMKTVSKMGDGDRDFTGAGGTESDGKPTKTYYHAVENEEDPKERFAIYLDTKADVWSSALYAGHATHCQKWEHYLEITKNLFENQEDVKKQQQRKAAIVVWRAAKMGVSLAAAAASGPAAPVVAPVVALGLEVASQYLSADSGSKEKATTDLFETLQQEMQKGFQALSSQLKDTCDHIIESVYMSELCSKKSDIQAQVETIYDLTEKINQASTPHRERFCKLNHLAEDMKELGKLADSYRRLMINVFQESYKQRGQLDDDQKMIKQAKLEKDMVEHVDTWWSALDELCKAYFFLKARRDEKVPKGVREAEPDANYFTETDFRFVEDIIYVGKKGADMSKKVRDLKQHWTFNPNLFDSRIVHGLYKQRQWIEEVYESMPAPSEPKASPPKVSKIASLFGMKNKDLILKASLDKIEKVSLKPLTEGMSKRNNQTLRHLNKISSEIVGDSPEAIVSFLDCVITSYQCATVGRIPLEGFQAERFESDFTSRIRELDIFSRRDAYQVFSKLATLLDSRVAAPPRFDNSKNDSAASPETAPAFVEHASFLASLWKEYASPPNCGRDIAVDCSGLGVDKPLRIARAPFMPLWVLRHLVSVHTGKSCREFDFAFDEHFEKIELSEFFAQQSSGEPLLMHILPDDQRQLRVVPASFEDGGFGPEDDVFKAARKAWLRAPPVDDDSRLNFEQAIKTNDFELANTILHVDKGLAIDAPAYARKEYASDEDDANDTPLVMVCRKGMVGVAKYLVDRGANVNQKARSGWTPLTAAAGLEDNPSVAYQLVELLLHARANVHQAAPAKPELWRPIEAAQWAHNEGVVELLLANGAQKEKPKRRVNPRASVQTIPDFECQRIMRQEAETAADIRTDRLAIYKSCDAGRKKVARGNRSKKVAVSAVPESNGE